MYVAGGSLRYAHITSLPKPRKTPESSAAIYPAPKTIARFGSSVNSKKPFESIAYSPPGILHLARFSACSDQNFFLLDMFRHLLPLFGYRQMLHIL